MARSVDERAPERAYHAIKRDLLSGALRFNQRIDPSSLAGALGVSSTPVREALIRLRVERLIAYKPAHGFFVALWSQAGLKALYQWRGALAVLAFAEGGAISARQSRGEYGERVRWVFTGANAKANPELIAAAENADDRLARARHAEASLWSNVEGELDHLASVLAQGSNATTLRVLRRYHQKRAAYAAEIRDRAVLLDLPSNGG